MTRMGLYKALSGQGNELRHRVEGRARTGPQDHRGCGLTNRSRVRRARRLDRVMELHEGKPWGWGRGRFDSINAELIPK